MRADGGRGARGKAGSLRRADLQAGVGAARGRCPRWRRPASAPRRPGARGEHPGSEAAPGRRLACARKEIPIDNPSRGVLRVNWGMPGRRRVSLYDIQGRRMGVLVDGEFDGGAHSVWWANGDGDVRVPGAGLYFVSLEQGDVKLVRRVVVLEGH